MHEDADPMTPEQEMFEFAKHRSAEWHAELEKVNGQIEELEHRRRLLIQGVEAAARVLNVKDKPTAEGGSTAPVSSRNW